MADDQEEEVKSEVADKEEKLGCAGQNPFTLIGNFYY